MANLQHLEQATYAVAVFNRWRDNHADILPDLSRADLTGAKLERTDLQTARGLTQGQVEGAHGDSSTRPLAPSMSTRFQSRPFMSPAALAISLSCFLVAEVSAQASTPDGGAADQSKPVQVFILLGQSNMLGFGRVGPADKQGTLEHMTENEGKYRHLVEPDGRWTVRKDVRYVHVMDKRGGSFRDMTNFSDRKNGWLTVSGNFGPELGFGHLMGRLHEAPVLVLKACIGNRSLGWDLLPPGSKRFEYQGRTYAGYGDEDSSWAEDDPYDPTDERGWYAGRQYDADTSHAKAVLKNLAKYYPGYQGQGYEVAGFVFWQGHKDQNAAHASRYEQNLVHFVKSLREDFDAPDAKFVLATIAFGGRALSGHGLTICKAQLAVDGAKGKYPEFKGNVKAIDARPFWREKDVSPSGQGYHYNHNAETYMEVGTALGRAMAELLKE